MIRNKNDISKPIRKLDSSVTEILVTEDPRLEPYIRSFHHESENIALAPLGSILGIFEIEDQSKESAYIVNFLASVVRKEYFHHPKRPAIESLEATLHKVNLMLSELIKQDNTAWLGKLNATICVLEKNNLHFSVAGNAKVLLIRDKILTDIGDGLAETEDPHPLKTFTEVSSGRLKTKDKILLATPGLFEICSAEELRRNADRFPCDKFAQFVKTALVNQLLFGGVIIIDIGEAKKDEKSILKQSETKTEEESVPNAFGQASFLREKKSVVQTNAFRETKPAASEIQIAKNEETIHREQDTDYTDAKTGHIYVQGEIGNAETPEWKTKALWMLEEARDAASAFGKTAFSRLVKTIREQDIRKKSLSFIKTSGKFFWRCIGYCFRILLSLIPHLSRAKSRFQQLNKRNKAFAIGALFFIFIIPFFLNRADTEKTTPKTEENQSIETPTHPLANEKNIQFVSSTASLLSNDRTVSVVTLQGIPFAITDNAVIDIQEPGSTKSSSVSSLTNASLVAASAMNDLNTIFLLTDQKTVFSFTPFNRNFSENKISFPSSGRISSIGTYLTYLYALDEENNAILRYPRADGGFGESVSWLKETTEINQGDTFAVSESIYLARRDRLQAFNRGKQESVSFEASATPIVFSAVDAHPGSSLLFVLDTVNGRVVQFEKTGKIIAQYANESLKQASSFTVNEAENEIYFVTPNGVSSFNIAK